MKRDNFLSMISFHFQGMIYVLFTVYVWSNEVIVIFIYIFDNNINAGKVLIKWKKSRNIFYIFVRFFGADK